MVPQEVIHGTINRWTDQLDITLDIGELEGLEAALRTHRDAVPARMQNVIQRWKAEERSFDEWFHVEAMAFGPETIRQITNHQLALMKVATGEIPMSLDVAAPPDSVILHAAMLHALESESVPESQRHKRATEYLLSEALVSLPFNNISSLMFAATARKVHAGQRRFPPSSMTDIKMISRLAPYCHAMFVDNAMLGLLGENPLPDRLGVETRFFGKRTLDEFEDFLSEIEQDALDDNLRIASAIYGPPPDPESWAERAFDPD